MPENNERLIPLSSMSVGQKAVIMAFSFVTRKGEKIQKTDVGLGEHLEVVRCLTPEGSIEIKIRGYFVSLRKEEADGIKVKLLP